MHPGKTFFNYYGEEGRYYVNRRRRRHPLDFTAKLDVNLLEKVKIITVLGTQFSQWNLKYEPKYHKYSD